MIRFRDTVMGLVDFVPENENRITMWVCGPTVYDVPHLGNARSAVVFDVVFRLLRYTYGDEAVVYARNYTDIDDKIIERANAEGISIKALTERTIAEYEQAMTDLNVLDPVLKPRATQHLRDINRMIGNLLESGAAYEAQDHILFSVEDSRQLTGLTGEVDRQAGHRVAVESYKRDPRDFVLWKPAKPGEPQYRGPGGLMGRMGWHIECSAMIERTLGRTIDIHAGGSDLVFPHHECEIMQSETVHAEPLSRYWLHNGMLTVDGDKMSKSAGNFTTVPDALRDAPGEAVRYLLLGGHYRQSLDWTQDRLRAAKTSLDRLYRALEAVWDADVTPVVPSVLAPLNDDLNTPDALAILHGLANRAFTDPDAARIKSDLIASGELLGLLQTSPADWFRADTNDDIEALIAERAAARSARDYVRSDEIRAQLFDLGVVIEDTPQGTVYRAK